MNKPYDVIVFIGRFQPLHLGHKEIIDYASANANHVVVVLGSDKQPRTIKNPFTTAEREEMFRTLGKSNVSTVAVMDQMYNDQRWVESVQEVVNAKVSKFGWTDYPRKIAIIGHNKDETSFYLDMFPMWESVDFPLNSIINATDIRKLLFGNEDIRYLKSVVPDNVYEMLKEFEKTKEYTSLVEEYNFVENYKKIWSVAPFPPIFVTTDAVVIQSGHILLVRRRASPGKGLWALPGGFLNPKERIIDGMIRELKEETKLKVPVPVLKGSIRKYNVFDHPSRSTRGRTITHAYMIELPSVGDLPKVYGSDDADKAKWVALADLKSEEMFEDHYSIIKYFV